MPVKNGKSVFRGVRVLTTNDNHLVKKANANPANPHNHVGTEINALIQADADYTKRTGKFRFSK